MYWLNDDFFGRGFWRWVLVVLGLAAVGVLAVLAGLILGVVWLVQHIHWG